MMPGNCYKRIIFLNFGGIGDELLFYPVIQAIRSALPESKLTLVMESRSKSVTELIPELNQCFTVDLKQSNKIILFLKLLKILKSKPFDAVISSGSSPFIALLLGLSGIPLRIGFDSGCLSHLFLTAAAPLNKTIYAGDMYFSLAKTFFKAAKIDISTNEPAIPNLIIDQEGRQRAIAMVSSCEMIAPKYRILIHPGVSRMSVEKNILKAWPVKYWQELIEMLLRKYPEASIYLAGGPDDAEIIKQLEEFRLTLASSYQARIINLYGKTANLRDLASLISICNLLISVDSAPMHLAVGLKTPVVAVFAPTDEKKLLPSGSMYQFVSRNDLACRPCLWGSRATSCDLPVCLDVPVPKVMDKVTTALE